MGRNVDKVVMTTLLVQMLTKCIMKDNGSRIKEMDKEYSNIIMERNIQGNEGQGNDMVLGNIYMQIMIGIKGDE